MPKQSESIDAGQWLELLGDLKQRQEREAARGFARQPKRIDKVIAQVMLRGGYGRQMSNDRLTEAWRTAAGETFARSTRPGNVTRGRLLVVVANSTVRQEIVYMKDEILRTLREQLPEEKINDLKFQVGNVARDES